MSCQVAETADQAFDLATEQARYDYGHAGYTGTIAEKHDFILLKRYATPLPDNTEAAHKVAIEERLAYAQSLLRSDSKEAEAVTDKWGPCGCIPLYQEARGVMFLFFGNASS
jgi:hypothetical protein